MSLIFKSSNGQKYSTPVPFTVQGLIVQNVKYICEGLSKSISPNDGRKIEYSLRQPKKKETEKMGKKRCYKEPKKIHCKDIAGMIPGNF
jgi:hypothetical protein